MTARRLASIAVLCLASVSGSAYAATGLGAALRGSPFQFFTEEDTRQFLSAARTLAETGKDGETARWANEASGAWGTMEIRRSFKRDASTPCREMRGENTARGRTEAFRLTTCRNAKGEWRIANSGPVKEPAKKPAPKPAPAADAAKPAEPAAPAKPPESTLPATVPETPPPGGTAAP
jgi:surface antigen